MVLLQLLQQWKTPLRVAVRRRNLSALIGVGTCHCIGMWTPGGITKRTHEKATSQPSCHWLHWSSQTTKRYVVRPACERAMYVVASLWMFCFQVRVGLIQQIRSTIVDRPYVRARACVRACVRVCCVACGWMLDAPSPGRPCDGPRKHCFPGAMGFRKPSYQTKQVHSAAHLLHTCS